MSNWLLIEIDSSGVIGHTSSSSTRTNDQDVKKYYTQLLDRSFIIDRRPCLNDANYPIKVVSSPMVDFSLKGSFKRGIFTGTSICLDPSETESMDFVSPEIYISVWRQNGATIGQRINNKIVWESGFTENIS